MLAGRMLGVHRKFTQRPFDNLLGDQRQSNIGRANDNGWRWLVPFQSGKPANRIRMKRLFTEPDFGRGGLQDALAEFGRWPAVVMIDNRISYD